MVYIVYIYVYLVVHVKIIKRLWAWGGRGLYGKPAHKIQMKN